MSPLWVFYDEEVVSQVIESIRIAGKAIDNVEIEFGNFSSKIGIDGFIGNDILGRFKTTIDFCTNTILFE